MKAETKRDADLAEAYRLGWYAAVLLAVAVLQGVAHHWWLFGLVLFYALLSGAGAVAFWASARDAEPWEQPDPPKRPSRLVLVLDVVAACVIAAAALSALVVGDWFGLASWVLYGTVLVDMARRTVLLRRITAPAKVPVRPGPPEEWL